MINWLCFFFIESTLSSWLLTSPHVRRILSRWRHNAFCSLALCVFIDFIFTWQEKVKFIKRGNLFVSRLTSYLSFAHKASKWACTARLAENSLSWYLRQTHTSSWIQIYMIKVLVFFLNIRKIKYKMFEIYKKRHFSIYYSGFFFTAEIDSGTYVTCLRTQISLFEFRKMPTSAYCSGAICSKWPLFFL